MRPNHDCKKCADPSHSIRQYRPAALRGIPTAAGRSHAAQGSLAVLGPSWG
jgi:hypothetical protein